MRRLKILTWGNCPDYLACLQRTGHDFHLATRSPELRRLRFDCILFQDARQYLDEQYELLSPAQRRAPKVFLEHQPPRQHPVDSRHAVTDPHVTVVHVTAFNRLMWDNGNSPTRVIEPGVPDPGEAWTGHLERGLVLGDGMARRSRRHGHDLLELARRAVPLDFPDGSAPPGAYRFAFSPARYASPGLGLAGAMAAGLPVIAPDTAGISGVVRNGASGYVDADPDVLVRRMRGLLRDRDLAGRLGRTARRVALRRFGLERFAADWNRLFADVVIGRRERAAA